MRLDFNILWVEDQPAAVKAQHERIAFQLRKQGFRVHAEFATSVQKAEEFLGSDIFGDNVDLVLMDYDLGQGPNGGVGIEKVRDRFSFKDIVFYSASGVQKLQQSMADGKFQGVFYSSRQDLPDTVVGVFEALVKKVLDIEHSRGIVMGATSEIDDFVNRALEIYLSKSGSEIKAEALRIAKEQIEKIRSAFEDECGKLEALKDATELKAFHRIYTSAKRLILLRKLLKVSGRTDIDFQAMIDYETKTVPERNTLAHVSVERNGFARRIFNKNGEELTVENMRALRVELLTHHELFEALLKAL